jgi:hypothetical protein
MHYITVDQHYEHLHMTANIESFTYRLTLV